MAINAARPEDDPTFRQAIPVDAPAPPRPQRPLPNRSAPPPMPQQQAARPAPQQAIPNNGNDDSGWLPPDEAERQNIAAHKELGKDYNPKRLATTEFLPEIARAVRTTVQSMFGIGGEGQAVPAERANIPGFARSEGRASSQDVKAAKAAVDPENKLPPHLQSLAAFNGAYVFWNAQGDPKKAKAAIAEYALAAKHTLMQLGTLGQAAIEAGDMKALARILQDGYAEIPDGNYIEAKPKGKGLDVKLFDANGKLTEQGEMGMDMLTELVTGMQNGTVWLRSLAALEKRDEVDPKKQEADELAREAANTRNRATIAGGTSGAGGRGSAAERAAAQRQQQHTQRLETIQNDPELDETQRSAAVMVELSDHGFQTNQRTSVNATDRRAVADALPEINEKFDGQDAATKRRTQQLALEIWRSSTAIDDPATAAEIALGLMSPDFFERIEFDGQSGAFSLDGMAFYLRGPTLKGLLDFHQPPTPTGDAGGKTPGSAAPEPPPTPAGDAQRRSQASDAAAQTGADNRERETARRDLQRRQEEKQKLVEQAKELGVEDPESMSVEILRETVRDLPASRRAEERLGEMNLPPHIRSGGPEELGTLQGRLNRLRPELGLEAIRAMSLEELRAALSGGRN